MIVDEVAGKLLIRTTSDPMAAFTALANALPAELDRVTILITPSVTRSPDIVAVLADIVRDRLRHRGPDIRLISLGPMPEAETAESQLRALAESTGREVVGHVGRVTVSSDGTVAVAAPPGARGGWVLCGPDGVRIREHAWFPLPRWARLLPPATAGILDRGVSSMHPVPAGFWILPHGLRPGIAGSAAMVPPHPTTLTVFLGGCPEPALQLGDIAESLAALPLSAPTRVVVLPNGLPRADGHARQLTRLHSSVPIVAAVPARTTANAWELATVSATGHVTWRPSLSRTPAPRPKPYSPERRVRPLPRAASSTPPPAARTPAGWSFLTDAAPIGVVPAGAGFVIEVDVDSSGFRLAGRPVKPSALGQSIDACRELGRGAVIVVGRGTTPTGNAADRLFGPLAQALGREVIAADADVSLSFAGQLFTSGQFRVWQPSMDGSPRQTPRSRPLGNTLPPIASPPHPHELHEHANLRPVSPPPGPPHALESEWTSVHVEPDTEAVRPDTFLSAHIEPPRGSRDNASLRRVRPPTGVDDDWAVLPSADPIPTGRHTSQPVPSSPDTPVWIAAAACHDEDRVLLRRALDGQYDAHARAVAAALAAGTGLASPHPTASVVTGLVAVRAYCVNEGDAINLVLRGNGNPPRAAAATAVAACAATGLRGLPLALGPLFAARRLSVPISTYRPGMELAEPGFVDAEYFPTNRPETDVEFVIWSASARRLGPLGSGEHAGALFPPGARFLVLDVEATAWPLRVLLFDLASPHSDPAEGSGPPTRDEVAHRLRQAAGQPRVRGTEPSAATGLLIGLDGSGRQFLRPAGKLGVASREFRR